MLTLIAFFLLRFVVEDVDPSDVRVSGVFVASGAVSDFGLIAGDSAVVASES